MIEEAAAATDAASALASEAADNLAAFAGGTFNGFGLFSDPSQQRAYLARAAKAVTAALAAMDAARWPSPAEMREAEEAAHADQP
ncbi:hypothetical protein A3862_29925 (plasmid) [Methylobacterium sp. XJLW]|uniref:hypothetical protein n=1 Tax=Methylobacterium sp. XJLW TaxID=739141 RepID=UPI000DAB0C4B|nr:hypothetical protein [Methylobacterium sp. XJLW]AWV19931.1 hypothetical protein A3862_29925 [Methylobacterium sp. XJLW]